MKTSHYQPVPFSNQRTYNERTKCFVGVDLTNPQMNVDPNRGVYARNYIMKQTGRVETRFGYKQISNDMVLLGMWEWGKDGSNLLAAVSDMEYKTENNADGYVIKIIIPTRDNNGYLNLSADAFNTVETLSDCQTTNVFGIYAENRLWLLIDGHYLFTEIYNNATVIRNALDYAYVPTVTYMGIPVNADVSADGTFTTLEQPNVLSKFRNDKYLFGRDLAEGNYPMVIIDQYVVGSDIEVFAKGTKNGQIKTLGLVGVVDGNSTQGVTYGSNLTVDEKALVDDFFDGAYVLSWLVADNSVSAADKAILTGASENITGVTVIDIDVDGKGYTFFELRVNYTSGLSSNTLYVNIYGAVMSYVGELFARDTRVMKLLSNPASPDVAEPNVTIKYQYISDENFATQTSAVFKNTFGILFGANNSLNRLWLAGNPEHPNYLYFSGEPYELDSDGNPVPSFLYFPEKNILKLGEDGNSIVGLDVMSVDKMVAIKNKAGSERTMYFIEPEAIMGKDGIEREVYKTSLSNTATAGISNKSIVNFNGQTLFVSSDNQVVGFDIEGITGDSQRVATTRSRYIDRVLLQSDLSHALLSSFQNYLLLITDEALYFSFVSSFDSETKQLEWWPCDPLPIHAIKAFAGHDGKMYVSCYDEDTGEKGVYTFSDIDENGELADEYMIRTGYSSSNTMTTSDGKLVVGNTVFEQVPDISSYAQETENSRFFDIERPMIGRPIVVSAKDIEHLTSDKSSNLMLQDNDEGTIVPVKLEYVSGNSFNIIDVTTGSAVVCSRANPSLQLLERNKDSEVETSFHYDNVKGVLSHDVGSKSNADFRVRRIPTGLVFFSCYSKKAYEWLNESATIRVKVNTTEQGHRYKMVPSQSSDGLLTFTLKDESGTQFTKALSEFADKDFTLSVELDTSKADIVAYKNTTEDSVTNDVELYAKTSEGLEHLNAIKYYDLEETGSVNATMTTRKRINAYFITLRLVQGKLGYDKTISNIAIFNDSSNPSDLYVGMVTNKGIDAMKRNSAFLPGIDMDFNAINFESTNFDSVVAPTIYNMKRFLRSQQSFSIVFSSKSFKNSVLGGIDILYTIKKARNKR